MNLSNILATTRTRKKRGGLGHGSGRGKTAGRGTKGQKARRTIPLRFDGANLSILERLPFTRGKGRNKVFAQKPVIINIKALNLLPKETVVTMESLIKYKMVNEKDARLYGIKILGDGELTQALTVSLPASKGAQAKIEKAGGTIKKKS